MASRKVYVHLDIEVIMVVEEGTEIQEVVDELDYSIADTTGNADILDTTICDHIVIDSK